MGVSRRNLLSGAASAALLSVAHGVNAQITPRQSLGPFYPITQPLDSDADLTFVEGLDGQASGEITHLHGYVSDTNGNTIANARVEIWQCDAFGAYHHPHAGGGKDPHFQGYGKTLTDDQGRYRFKTIKPVVYPGRAPHIHMKISTATTELVTQIYVEGEEINERDFLLNAIRNKDAKESLIVPFKRNDSDASGELVAVFNPVLPSA